MKSDSVTCDEMFEFAMALGLRTVAPLHCHFNKRRSGNGESYYLRQGNGAGSADYQHGQGNGSTEFRNQINYVPCGCGLVFGYGDDNGKGPIGCGS